MENTVISGLNNEKVPLYMRVYEYYKDLITEGKLAPGARLPSIRRCEKELSVSRTTAEAAYFQLAADGYAVSKPQSGYFVTDVARHEKKDGAVRGKKELEPKIDYDFTSLSADRESFDFALWRRYIKSALRQDERLLSYGEAQGERELREALCKYITEHRNAVCSPDNIVIGAGVQSLLHIICAVLPRSQKVFFGDPEFEQGGAVFSDHGFKSCRTKEEADIIYVSPSHINRLGDVMPTSERLRLIRLADRKNKLIIEDDYDSEFGYFNRPTPSLQGLDCGRNVIYIGTFSKLLLPSIRLSFMILPDALLGEYEKKAELYNQTASKTEQIALCSFIRDGNLSIRIRKIKRLYTQKMKLLSLAVGEVFGDKANIYIGETGFVLRLEIKCALSEKEVVERALGRGVAVKESGTGKKYPQILLLCSSVASDDFLPAVKRLYDSIFGI